MDAPIAPTAVETRLLAAMRRYWGYDSFLPLQAQAMTAAMTGRDSVVVLPTGGGKSLCFQAPAVCRDGLALVVSPLISLMKDQVDALRACGVPAAAINSTQTPGERRIIAEQIRRGELKLVYVAPERLLAERTLDFFTRTPLSLVAIDEAHCISQWGHDFRPEYRGLRVLKQAFPRVGVHAYTATASKVVQQDIAEQLGLVDPQMLIGSFDRPNLVFRIRRSSSRLQEAVKLIEQRRGEAGIVYCISRKEVDRTAEALTAMGYRAVPYHAGLSDDQRHRHQDAFLEERADIVVATVAFGMGIDKSNVRYVIHLGMPKSLEHYVQESGRAGRDGLEADCLLLYSGRDAMTWRSLIAKDDSAAEAGALESLAAMERFCGSVACRHRAIVRYFGQELDKENCGACDVCLGELDLVDEPLVLAQKILSCVLRLDQRYGADYTAKVLAGSREARILEQRHDQLSTYGLLDSHDASTIREWIEQLVSQAFLAKTGEFNTLSLTESGRALLRGAGAPQLIKPAPSKSRERRTPGIGQEDSWEGVDRGLFEVLRGLRTGLAAERGVPPYVVFGDTALRDMARRRPSSLEGFLDVRGVGEHKRDEYGAAFVEAIVAYCAASGVARDARPPQRAPSLGDEARESQRPAAAALVAAFEQFGRGASIEEASQRLSRAQSTVLGYLTQYIAAKQVTDPSPWVNAASARRIEEAIEAVGSAALKPIFEHLNREISYDEIRIVAACLANR
ncbi:MAG: DNA helicase RecQ [Planctomycetota bacterium]|nr:MAG: DNA helicase RecQ [Planctomycetota bacterium]